VGAVLRREPPLSSTYQACAEIGFGLSIIVAAVDAASRGCPEAVRVEGGSEVLGVSDKVAGVAPDLGAYRACNDEARHGEANPLVMDPAKGSELAEESLDEGYVATEVSLKRGLGCGSTGAEVKEEEEKFLFCGFVHIRIIDDH